MSLRRFIYFSGNPFFLIKSIFSLSGNLFFLRQSIFSLSENPFFSLEIHFSLGKSYFFSGKLIFFPGNPFSLSWEIHFFSLRKSNFFLRKFIFSREIVRSCLLITLIKCLKGHKSLGSLCSVGKTLVPNQPRDQRTDRQCHLLSCQTLVWTAKNKSGKLKQCFSFFFLEVYALSQKNSG